MSGTKLQEEGHTGGEIRGEEAGGMAGRTCRPGRPRNQEGTGRAVKGREPG